MRKLIQGRVDGGLDGGPGRDDMARGVGEEHRQRAEEMLASTSSDSAPLRDAVVVIDNMVEAVAFYCRAESKEPTKESAQTELPEEGKGG